MKTNVAALKMLMNKKQTDRGISGALQVHLKCLEEDLATLESTVIRLKAQQRQQMSCMTRLLEKKSVSVQ